MPFSTWFASLLRDELRPYPGRLALVLRMTLAATLTMIAIMTFRLPGAAIAAYYTLLLSRESPVSTVRAAILVLTMYAVGASYTLVCALLFVDYPVTHFIWICFSLFLCFFVIKITKNYVAAAAFAFIITIAIPIWDTPAPTALLVASTLWAAGSVSVGLICTIAVEYLFTSVRTRDEYATAVRTRAAALAEYLRSLSAKSSDRPKREQAVHRLAMVGVSRLRTLARLGTANRADTPERRSTSVALLGRAIDLAAALPPNHELSAEEQRLLNLCADELDRMAHHIASGTVPHSGPPIEMRPGIHPLLGELARAVDLLVLSRSQDVAASLGGEETSGKDSPFVADAFTNPEHLIFSVRGCVAAMLCYVILNAIAWRGLSTSLATCVITALTSIGSSRQKQLLRLSGAVAGGLLLGIGSQVLILPMLDSIAGFTVLFIVVTLISGWISTSSPRISYFGQQVALAFYLIHLQEYYPQTNLAIARDRVMGVALGLVMMWLVFDTLGSRPAAQVMRELFASNLILLSQFVQPWPEGRRADVASLRALRDRISNNFGSVNAQGDAVLFEIGPMRKRQLKLRDQLLAWQPRLRSLFLIEIGLAQYRVDVNPADLHQAILSAQRTFDERVSSMLEGMARTLQNKAPTDVLDVNHVRESFEDLEAAIHEAYGPTPTARAQGVLALSRDLTELLSSLAEEMRQCSLVA